MGPAHLLAFGIVNFQGQISNVYMHDAVECFSEQLNNAPDAGTRRYKQNKIIVGFTGAFI